MFVPFFDPENGGENEQSVNSPPHARSGAEKKPIWMSVRLLSKGLSVNVFMI